MNLFSGGVQKLKARGGKDSSEDEAPEGSEPDDTSILDEKEGSIIMSMISQLRIGMDLSKVAFPTFVLEPRSMLERITDFMSHPDLIFGAEQEDSDEERFIRVIQYYLSGWHVKPKGVKKPYNPVLGEFFRCRYDYPNGTQAFYIAEQVSHHPPCSAYFYISPQNLLRISGELRPKSKFLGNSAQTIMEGENRVFLMGKPEDGEYVITMPSMYARGILFGKMVLELGDTCAVENKRTNLRCDINFKTKGYFSGSYNSVVGKVKKGVSEKGGTDVGEISGRWSHAMEYKPCKADKGDKRLLFDANSDQAKSFPKFVPPESEQEVNESRRLWSNLTAAIEEKNMERAQEAKSAVEDAQREERRKREESAAPEWTPRFFVRNSEGRWVPKVRLSDDPSEAAEAVKRWIWPEAAETQDA